MTEKEKSESKSEAFLVTATKGSTARTGGSRIQPTSAHGHRLGDGRSVAGATAVAGLSVLKSKAETLNALEDAMQAHLDSPVKGDFMSLTREWGSILEDFRAEEMDASMLITALAFLGVHYEQARDECLRDSYDERLNPTTRVDCSNVAYHHQRQLWEVGEQIALLGGRNAYLRGYAIPPEVDLSVSSVPPIPKGA